MEGNAHGMERNAHGMEGNAHIEQLTVTNRRSSGGEEGAECLGEDLKHRSDRDADYGTNGANEDGADVMDNAVGIYID